MKSSHKIAEEKYRNIRSIAYEITMDELPYQDKTNIRGKCLERQGYPYSSNCL